MQYNTKDNQREAITFIAPAETERKDTQKGETTVRTYK